MVPNAGKILDLPAPDKHDGVLLQIVAFARDIGQYF
jgi:hypothetical protein